MFRPSSALPAAAPTCCGRCCVTTEPGSPNRQSTTRRLDSIIETPFCQLPAVALLAGELGAAATAGPVALRMQLVTVAAVAVPAGQALERGPGHLPVAAAAGGLPARLGAQQPLGVDLVPLADGRGRPLPVVAAAIGVGGAAAAARLPAAPAGLLPGGPSGRRSRPPVPGRSPPAMLRRRWVVEAVGAPVAV